MATTIAILTSHYGYHIYFCLAKDLQFPVTLGRGSTETRTFAFGASAPRAAPVERATAEPSRCTPWARGGGVGTDVGGMSKSAWTSLQKKPLSGGWFLEGC